MTENTVRSVRHVGEARESHGKAFKLSKKMKTKTYMSGLKKSQSPSYRNSFNSRQAFTTPKRRPRIRFNRSCPGDSPNDSELTQEDIVWDANSPTQNLNGKIAPKVKKAEEGDLVRQCFGDSAIPSTPEILQPRVKRVSARHSNVEGLMKLAKKIDKNMTRQDKEKELEGGEETNKSNEHSGHSMKEQRSTSDSLSELKNSSYQARMEEQALHALFDGPTQNISGRLSPLSVNSTAENSSVSDVQSRMSSMAKKKDLDDWENDDLLNDFLVLETTQNPGAAKQSETGKLIVGAKNPTLSNGTNICSETHQKTTKPSTLTETLPEVRMCSISTFKPKPPDSAENQTTEKLPNMPSMKNVKQKICSTWGSEANLDSTTKTSQSSSAHFDGVSEEDMQSLFDFDGLWNDEDDDFLKACDDVEMSSDNQKAKVTASKATASSNVVINKIDHAQESPKSSRVFISSNATPRCSAAEIERKKQEAIARRRLRMQTSQKNTSPT
ncbi:hypothetical protein DNTS_035644 [Danionella cerebrum]|uniref:Ewing's tumor-associated antigen 1 n=1 Tax=Danionella cerebrum TaxID=2873325 RepID=A0A553R9G6_9TELE|nr:hypothetical protein DNTS_035644 [Danionella translucida]